MWFGFNGFSQTVEVKINRNHILIGEKINYELKIGLPDAGTLVNFYLPDTIPHFEIVESKPFDTIMESNIQMLHKLLVLTSFDSGSIVIPSFDVEIGPPGNGKVIKTQPLKVEVGYSPSSGPQLKDIKPIMGVTVTDNRWLYIIAIVIGFLILLFLAFLYFKKRKKQSAPIFNSRLSPLDEAMEALRRLKWTGSNRAEVINYHDTLALVFKRFYSRQQNINLLSATTSDLLVMLKADRVDSRIVSEIAGALREADAVKFARFIPVEEEASQQKQRLEFAIQSIHSSITNQER